MSCTAIDAVHVVREALGELTRARYDGWADWYEEYLGAAYSELYAAATDTLLRLLGAGPGRCLDLGCGIGHHLPEIEGAGWSAIGLDISSDMLRRASLRSRALVGAVAEALPFGREVLDAVVSSWTYTDFDDVAPVFAEVARVLRPGGRFVCVGVHPCFVGPFAQRRDDEAVVIHPGYRDTERRFEGPGMGDRGVRSKVGVRHVPLGELFTKLAGAGLRVEAVEEPERPSGPTPMLLGVLASNR